MNAYQFEFTYNHKGDSLVMTQTEHVQSINDLESLTCAVIKLRFSLHETKSRKSNAIIQNRLINMQNTKARTY